MLAAYLIDPARRGYPLEELAGDEGIGAEVEGDGDGVAAEAVVTRVLAERQRERLEDDGLTRLLHEVELPLVDVLVEMERAGREARRGHRCARSPSGSRRRPTRSSARSGCWPARSSRSARRSSWPRSCSTSSGCRRSAAARPASPPTRACSRPSAREHEIIPKIESWRELTKLKSTYLDAFPELVGADGRLHTTFNQAAATTGRLSSTDPNLQNIPIRTELGREIRACFVAEEGKRLISADYSQVELRILAHIAGEEVLKEIFQRGEDVHTATAEQILGGKADPGTRSKAKMVNYGIVYGLSAYGLADRLGISQEEAQEFIDRYLERFPKVREFIDGTIESGEGERATSPRCSAASAGSPSCAPASARPGCWASAWR